MISSPIFKWILPEVALDGNALTLARVRDVALFVIAPFSVVVIPEDAPAIVTLLSTSYI